MNKASSNNHFKSTNHTLSGHYMIIDKNVSWTDIRKLFFSNQVIDLRNNSSHVRRQSSQGVYNILRGH